MEFWKNVVMMIEGQRSTLYFHCIHLNNSGYLRIKWKSKSFALQIKDELKIYYFLYLARYGFFGSRVCRNMLSLNISGNRFVVESFTVFKLKAFNVQIKLFSIRKSVMHTSKKSVNFIDCHGKLFIYLWK